MRYGDADEDAKQADGISSCCERAVGCCSSCKRQSCQADVFGPTSQYNRTIVLELTLLHMDRSLASCSSSHSRKQQHGQTTIPVACDFVAPSLQFAHFGDWKSCLSARR